MLLDHRRFLAGDPVTVHMVASASRQQARKYFDDPVVIQSVVQAALLAVTLKLHAGEEPEPEQLLHLIYNCTLNAIRKELRRKRRHVAVSYESQLHGRAPTDISQTVRLRRDLRDIESALERGDDKARRILEERIRGESYRMIAKLLATSEGAARESISQLRKRLIGELTARDKAEFLMRQARRLGLDDQSSGPDESTNS